MKFEHTRDIYDDQPRITSRVVTEYAREVLLKCSDSSAMSMGEGSSLDTYWASWTDTHTGCDVYLTAPDGLGEDGYFLLDTRDSTLDQDVQYVFSATEPRVYKTIIVEQGPRAGRADQDTAVSAYELLMTSGVSPCRTSGAANEVFWEIAADITLTQPQVRKVLEVAAQQMGWSISRDEAVDAVVDAAESIFVQGEGDYATGVAVNRIERRARQRVSRASESNRNL